MKRRMLIAVFILMLLASGWSRSLAAPPPDFGSPPSGEVPILFNDQHVYANPTTLRNGRVLAGLVKDGQLMVPLRSMFEQMGATVTYDAASQSATAAKPGVQVQVTLGKQEVLLNGESRPLDVPPMMYKGVLLVPVRVLSEALGAYVEWVPSQRLTVVRYLAPTPVPAPVATPVPTAPPTPAPAPKPEGWQVGVTPYLWLATIKGVINYHVTQLPNGGSGQLTLTAGPNDYLNKLNSALMFAIDAHNRNIDLFSDFMTMNFSNTNTVSAVITGPFGRRELPVSLQAGARMVTNLWTVGAGAPVIQDKSVVADLFIGERFTQPKSSLDWTLTSSSPFLNRTGSASFNTTIYDFIGGAKGQVFLSPDRALYIPFYVDVGSGTFGSTWQYFGGVGYGRRGSLVVGYRGLAYTSSAGHVPNLQFYGPLVGYTFRF